MSLLFITNAAFLIFITGELLPKIIVNVTYFIPLFLLTALFVTSILYFVCLVLILMMYYQLHVKFTLKNGLSINIPTIYEDKLNIFNISMTVTFFISSILLIIFYYKEDKLNVNFFEFLKYMTVNSTIRNYLLFICFILSIIIIVISSIQTSRANELSKISGFLLNTSEINKNN
jgi:branched-subunit amino acid transport protein